MSGRSVAAAVRESSWRVVTVLAALAGWAFLAHWLGLAR